MTPAWTGTVEFDTRLGPLLFKVEFLRASSVWHATRQAVQRAKEKVPRGTRIYAVTVKLGRV
jgi:hypothetical protein